MKNFILILNGIVVDTHETEDDGFKGKPGSTFMVDYDTVVEDYDHKFSVGDIYSIEAFNQKYPNHEFKDMSLEDLIRAKQSKISDSAEKLMTRSILLNGKFFEAREKDRANMLEKFSELRFLTPTKQTVDWITEDNITVTLSRDDFELLVHVIGRRREIITFMSRQYKDSLLTMTYEEVMNTNTDLSVIYDEFAGPRDQEFSSIQTVINQDA